MTEKGRIEPFGGRDPNGRYRMVLMLREGQSYSSLPRQIRRKLVRLWRERRRSRYPDGAPWSLAVDLIASRLGVDHGEQHLRVEGFPFLALRTGQPQRRRSLE